MNLWAVEPYTKRCTQVQICITAKCVQLIRRGTVLLTMDAVRRYFQKYCLQQTFYFQTIPADKRIAPAVIHCVKGHLYSASRRSLMAVQYNTSRRTLYQWSLLHSHSSPHPGLQLTGTSVSGILNLKDRLGQSWPEGLQTVFWYYYIMSKGHVVG